MASLPSLNDREHDLQKKIVENTYAGYSSAVAIETAVRAGINKDPFGRERVSQPTTIFDSKQLYDSAPLFWDDAQTSGAGTSSYHSTAYAATIMRVSAATAGVRVRQTKRRFNYQPGKGQLIQATCVLGPKQAGIVKRIGYFDENNGIFFQLDGNGLACVIRSSVSGSPLDTTVYQGAWVNENDDQFDGSGASGIAINTATAQIFHIDFEWLGVGLVNFGVIINGNLYYIHSSYHANVLTSVYMSNPNLPVRYEIQNTGTGPASELMHICSTVISEGGYEDNGVVLSYGTGNTHVDANVAGTVYACIGMRLKTTHLSVTIKNLGMSMMGSTANDNFLWQLYLNPTVAGSFTYASLASSSVEVAGGATANTITGGLVLNSATVASQTSVESALVNALNLGSTIGGTRDEIVLAVMPLGASVNLDIYSTVTWRELL